MLQGRLRTEKGWITWRLDEAKFDNGTVPKLAVDVDATWMDPLNDGLLAAGGSSRQPFDPH